MVGAASAVTAPTASSLAWLRSKAGDLPYGMPGILHNQNHKTHKNPEATAKGDEEIQDKQKGISSFREQVQVPAGLSCNEAEQMSVAPQEAQHVPSGKQQISNAPHLQSESARETAEQQPGPANATVQDGGSKLPAVSSRQGSEKYSHRRGRLSESGLQEKGSDSVDQLSGRPDSALKSIGQREACIETAEQKQDPAKDQNRGAESLQEDEDAETSVQNSAQADSSNAKETASSAFSEAGQQVQSSFKPAENVAAYCDTRTISVSQNT